MEYFICRLRLDEGDRFILWFQDEIDGVLLNTDGKILSFDLEHDARAYSCTEGLILASEIPRTLDLRPAEYDAFTATPLDCVAVLTALNFFTDVAASLPSQACAFLGLDREATVIYEKISGATTSRR